VFCRQNWRIFVFWTLFPKAMFVPGLDQERRHHGDDKRCGVIAFRTEKKQIWHILFPKKGKMRSTDFRGF
jgi:ribosomal protein L37E